MQPGQKGHRWPMRWPVPGARLWRWGPTVHGRNSIVCRCFRSTGRGNPTSCVCFSQVIAMRFPHGHMSIADKNRSKKVSQHISKQKKNGVNLKVVYPPWYATKISSKLDIPGRSKLPKQAERSSKKLLKAHFGLMSMDRTKRWDGASNHNAPHRFLQNNWWKFGI